MVTWQRRSSLGSRRVMSVTAFGAVLSFLLSPYYRAARSSCYLAGDPDRLDWGHGAMPNFAITEFSEVHSESALGSDDRPRYRRFTCGRIFAGLTFRGFASRGASRLTLADHLPRRLETSMRFWSGSLQYTDDSGSVAPVRRTGPSRISTPFAPRCSTTSAIGVFVRKHRSAEPGIGTAALGSNSRPASWRLIFCAPNAKA